MIQTAINSRNENALVYNIDDRHTSVDINCSLIIGLRRVGS